MTTAATEKNDLKQRPDPGFGRRGWPLVVLVVAMLSLSGWSYLLVMVADMVPAMDMTQVGPGMGVFNHFNIFSGLSAEARAALAVICLPAGATFGMPSAAMTGADLLRIFLMWAMMSMAMMVPTAIPMLKAYHARIGRGRGSRDGALVPSVAAIFGYLTVWLGYALVATLAQWGLSVAGGMTDMMAPASLALTTTVLFAAGLYQFTPAKAACLQRCWYPRWNFSEGMTGRGLVTGYGEGLSQGLICLGCCWAVMTVMFAVGLMNIIWIALLGGIMALEKTFPSKLFPKMIGAGLISWAGLLVGLIYT
ncbi:DUF2182 domain-containing protein [Roseibium sp.]|uniref:DUF2182 domain-containing protein n=1 Tax=Roseibium sp. TaxID=1936156 RepID=UPI003BAC6361